MKSGGQTLTLIPTAMFFTKNNVVPEELVKSVSELTIRCCYSTHSSLGEVIDFVSHLKFETLTACVKPNNQTTLSAVEELLNHGVSGRAMKMAEPGNKKETEDL